jgi:hypothetical protein
MTERRQVGADGISYLVVKPNNSGGFHRHGRVYDLKGIATLINQEDIEEGRTEKIRFDFSFEPPSIENEIRDYIRENMIRSKATEKVRS